MKKEQLYYFAITSFVLFCVFVVNLLFAGRLVSKRVVSGVMEDVLKDPVVEEKSVTMIAVGDLMLGRTVETLMKREGDGYPFAKIGDLLRGYDIVFGNLEGPIPEQHVQTPLGGFRFNFRKEVVSLLKDQGFTVVSLANNHALDFGQKGFEETNHRLDAVGIGYVGHYSHEQYDVYEAEVRGKKIVMVAFNMIEPDFDERAALAWALKAAKEIPHDVLLASVHWGVEYENRAAPEVRKFAYGLIDAGVDVILGGHPHVPQGIGVYKGKTIIYSMGNFVFDQYWSEPTQYGLAVAMTFDHEEIVLRLIPIDLHESQPRELEESRQAAWFGVLAGYSDEEIQEAVRNGKIVQIRQR
jgi:poly-gamma-glutamate synthesis protein (capsule biosynthesis protein)